MDLLCGWKDISFFFRVYGIAVKSDCYSSCDLRLYLMFWYLIVLWKHETHLQNNRSFSCMHTIAFSLMPLILCCGIELKISTFCIIMAIYVQARILMCTGLQNMQPQCSLQRHAVRILQTWNQSLFSSLFFLFHFFMCVCVLKFSRYIELPLPYLFSFVNILWILL